MFAPGVLGSSGTYGHMAEETNAPSIDTFDLLDGADVSGGLVFTRSDEPEEDDDWEPFPEPEYDVDETAGEILS